MAAARLHTNNFVNELLLADGLVNLVHSVLTGTGRSESQ